MTCSNSGQTFTRTGLSLQQLNRTVLALVATSVSLSGLHYGYGIATGTILMPYGDTWHLYRRIFHQATSAEVAVSYRPMQCAKARQLIVNLTDNLWNFSSHFHTFAWLVFGHL